MCNGTPFTVEKVSPRAGIEPKTVRSVSYNTKAVRRISRQALNPLSYRGSSLLDGEQADDTAHAIRRPKDMRRCESSNLHWQELAISPLSFASDNRFNPLYTDGLFRCYMLD